MVRKIILTTMLFALSSCSYIYGERGVIKNRDTDYLSAQSLPPLRIPPGLSSSTLQAHYPIADRNYTSTQKRINLTPPELQPAPSARRPAQPVKAQPVTQATTATVAVNNAPAHKQRYLTDVFSHPEYVTQSFIPNKKTSAPQKQTVATKQQTTAPTPIQQANNSKPTTPATKKKYIADYFQ